MLWRLLRLELRGTAGVALTIVDVLVLSRRQVAGSAVKAPVIPPFGPLGGRQLELLEGPPGASAADELGLLEADHSLGEGVVVGVAARPH